MADRKGFVARGRLTVAGSQRENIVIKKNLSCAAKNYTSHKKGEKNTEIKNLSHLLLSD